MSEIMTPKEVANYLKMSVLTVYKHAKMGKPVQRKSRRRFMWRKSRWIVFGQRLHDVVAADDADQPAIIQHRITLEATADEQLSHR